MILDEWSNTVEMGLQTTCDSRAWWDVLFSNWTIYRTVRAF